VPVGVIATGYAATAYAAVAVVAAGSAAPAVAAVAVVATGSCFATSSDPGREVV
jgi:hypothetical protein